MSKKLKTNQRTLIPDKKRLLLTGGVVICGLVVAFYLFIFLDYQDKQKFTQLKEDTAELGKRLNKKFNHNPIWSEKTECLRGYNNAAEGGWNCSSSVNAKIDNNQFNDTREHLASVLKKSNDLFIDIQSGPSSSSPSRDYITRKNNVNCHLDYGMLENEQNTTTLIFSCVDTARSSWYPSE